MKRLWKSLVGVSLASVLVLGGCGSTEDTQGGGEGGDDTEKTVTVAINQFVEHPSLDAATEGFKKALAENGFTEGENLEYVIDNAQADMNNIHTIANKHVSDEVDLIFANATPSAQASVQAVKKANAEIPVLFTSVTDPVGAELIEAMDQPGEWVTGTSDTHPEAIPNTIKFIAEQTDAKTVGLIYNPGEQNSVAQVEIVKKAMEGTGLKAAEASVATTADVKQAAESLVDEADVLYIITDNTVVSALESVIKVAQDEDIPMFAGELDSVNRGAMAAYGFDYADLGYETGLMAAAILKGEKKPSDFEAQYPQNLKLVINKTAAEEMGVEIKSEWDDMAEYIE
ncbi:ABC transporter substrate-binding protein [Alkalihalobacillus sp. AL-G]|uniref:ABC transporter substrate-binding protein n=1 Tax=Alkalihalobacillus sp. AL-G TaxID=2926399 RepID=UPI00272A67E7|nr:ABC transporter substrate-binding protein [Alkalihalobacillus sp. AL-G]WLD94135.1 ABC transporter substrate-binding protein [Alkalihalobacillus sp. AL-G]